MQREDRSKNRKQDKDKNENISLAEEFNSIKNNQNNEINQNSQNNKRSKANKDSMNRKRNTGGDMDKDKQKNDDDDKKGAYKTRIIVLSIILFISLMILSIILLSTAKKDDDIYSYNNLVQDIRLKNVEKIEMTRGSGSVSVVKTPEAHKKDVEERIQKLKEEGRSEEEIKALETKQDLSLFAKMFSSVDQQNKKEEKERTRIVTIPSTDEFVKLVQEAMDQNEDLVFNIKNPPFVLKVFDVLFSVLPIVILVALAFTIFKMQGLDDKSKVYGDDQANKVDVGFDDVAGLNEEKNELMEVVDFLKAPERYRDMGAKVPRGILLYGKPGTGKTLIAKAIAGEAAVPFISMSGSEFIEMFAGLGASRVRKLFDKARKVAPCIIFIDEIDAIGSRRASGSGAETENNQTLNQLLVEMDGFSSTDNIIVLAATNRPEMLDKALLRPGRFDRIITIPAPDFNGRKEILELHAKGKKFSDDVDFSEMAGDTAGFTGAELSNILNEAAIIATRHNHDVIEKLDIEEAVMKITMGLEKQNRVISKKDKTITAYHEVGHAVVSTFLPTQTSVKELSIIPRGLAGGYTSYKPEEDKSYLSKTELLEQITSLMGGRASEELFIGDISTGASNDIERATDIAKSMIVTYGMSKEIGPISLEFEDETEMVYFGDEITKEVGIEIKEIIEKQYAQALRILKENEDIVHKIAEALFKKEKITESEFKDFFKDIVLPKKNNLEVNANTSSSSSSNNN